MKLATAGLGLLGSLVVSTPAGGAPPPNVLLIILDDQNGYAGRTDLAPQPVTPHLDRLAKRGVTFANAQCAAPVCNPSRTALLSGLRPSTTGIYDNSQDSLPEDHILRHSTPLTEYFRQHGYLTAGGGKVYGSAMGSLLKHHTWDETIDSGNKGRLEDPIPPPEKIPLNGIGKHDWDAFPGSREEMGDWQLAGWAATFLEREQPKPFFLACGIVKPHTPWYVPQEYFNLFPPGQIKIPDLAEDETAGLPAAARMKTSANEQQLAARRKELVTAYLAASRYADDCAGRILDALDKGPHRDRTIVIICGDNGYQFGEKNNWSKGRLWEGSAHVPLVMAGPGITRGATSVRPVSLVDLYPTLLELTGLPAVPGLDGLSFVSLLRDPSAPRNRPALTTAGFKNHALRTERWRYIRYADGSEELYDHRKDPLERTNLASQPDTAPVRETLRKSLPQTDAPRYPDTAKGKTREE